MTGPAPERPPPSAAAPPPGATASASPRPSAAPRTFRERSGAFWQRHRTLFWALHSVWALATGIAVVLLARERYAFVPWVVVFLGITWASTLFFGRQAGERAEELQPYTPGLKQELTSYLTRTLYQETLFFLLPFYAYSTVLRSPNVLFLVLLGGLALFSCLDLVFDRWLRTRVVFGMLFFASVSFAALNLLLPFFFSLPPRLGTPLSAVLAVGSAVPLALQAGVRSRGTGLRIALAAAAILGIAIGLPSVVPPVPLRMESATFASDIDPETLQLADTLASAASAADIGERLVVLVHVFAPAVVPSRVSLDWTRDGEALKSSRTVEILAHEGSFRVWDGYRAPSGRVEPGRYEVVLRTQNGRVFGRASLSLR